MSVAAALVRRGLLDNRRAPLVWGGSLGAMSALMVAIWPSIADSMQAVIDNYPPALKDAFGIDQLDTVEKYVDAEMLSLIVPLALAVFSVRCVVRAIVGAEERGHLDVLLSAPVARRMLVVSSFVVTALVAAAILLVLLVVTLVAAAIAGTGMSATTMAAGFANVWPLSIAFAGLATLAAGIMHRPGSVTALATGTLVAMYVADLAGKLSSDVEWLRGLSAFRYYGSAIQDGLDFSHIAGLTLTGFALAALGAVLFERRDIL